MALLIKAIGALLIVLAIASVAVWWIGSQQPSRALSEHETVIFVALKDGGDGDAAWPVDIAENALWKGEAQFALVGGGDAYWSRFAILPPGLDVEASVRPGENFADAYAAEVKITKVPTFALGLLRAQHLVGITNRPDGPLPSSADQVDGRRDILPDTRALTTLASMDPDQPLTMVNFLEYASPPDGEKGGGRAAYLRYGQEAFKAVHAVGGQFLFAGQVQEVLIAPQSHPVPVDWDDLAAMIYPDPTAILAMEQIDAYREALGERDKGLNSTRVIASIAQ